METASLYSGSRWIFSVFHAYVLQNWRVYLGLYSVPLRCFSCTLAHDSTPGSCFRRRRSSLCLVGLLFCGKSGAALSHIDWPAAVVFSWDLFGRVSPIPLDPRILAGMTTLVLYGLGCPEYWIVTAASVGVFVMCFILGSYSCFVVRFLQKALHWLSRPLFWSLPCTSLGYYLGDSPRSCQPPCNASLLG